MKNGRFRRNHSSRFFPLEGLRLPIDAETIEDALGDEPLNPDDDRSAALGLNAVDHPGDRPRRLDPESPSISPSSCGLPESLNCVIAVTGGASIRSQLCTERRVGKCAC